MFHHSDESSSGFFSGVLFGGALGALAVLLFTTEEGEKIQKKAIKKLHELEDAAEDYIKPKKSRSKKHSN